MKIEIDRQDLIDILDDLEMCYSNEGFNVKTQGIGPTYIKLMKLLDYSL